MALLCDFFVKSFLEFYSRMEVLGASDIIGAMNLLKGRQPYLVIMEVTSEWNRESAVITEIFPQAKLLFLSESHRYLSEVQSKFPQTPCLKKPLNTLLLKNTIANFIKEEE